MDIKAQVSAYVEMSYPTQARLEQGISENFQRLADWMEPELPNLSVEFRRNLVGTWAVKTAQELLKDYAS